MYIEPSTNIRILKGVPLDPSYEHTIYFDSATAQSDYFKSKTKYNLSNYTYQRVKRGYARIGLPADQVYDCNYMMFQNTGFGTKWFYAFITSVEYVNNQCTEIEFEIDVMQTWFFDYTLPMNFVEREHSETDEIGDNITAEPVNYGEYVYANQDTLASQNSAMGTELAVIVATVEVDESDVTDVWDRMEKKQGSPYIVDGNTIDGVYSGATLTAFEANNVQGINAFIDGFKKQPESIIGMYMCPRWVVNYDQPIPATGLKLPYGASGKALNTFLPAIQDTDSFGSYVPKNKKLYTYPYNYVSLLNGTGKSLALRYEFFDDLTPAIYTYGTISEPVQMVSKPYNYKGLKSVSPASPKSSSVHEEHIECNSFPVCSWNMDYYLSWKAQNSVPIALNTISTVASGMANVANANIVASMGHHPILQSRMTRYSTEATGVNAVSGLLSTLYTESIHADTLNGSFNNGSADSAQGFNTFFYARTHITEQMCKCIDEFFTKFGYATNRLKVPNRTARPHWNYTKLVSCTLEANSMPADDEKTICSIYEKGITFWKNASEVGNYSLDNSI